MAEESTRGASYDRFVDWDKRLSREAPFFRERFGATGARTLIDVGAGSGRHAIMFASWGIDVVAVDPDEGMLAQARENALTHSAEITAGGGSVRIMEGGFGGLAGLGIGPVDAVTCTGNALPHVAGRTGLTAALEDFAEVLVPGGLLILHLLNHARLLESRVRAIAPKVRDVEAGTRVYLRVVDYPPGGEYLDFDFVTATRDAAGEWTIEDRRSLHTAIPDVVLRSGLEGAGFEDVRFMGDHEGRPLDRSTDESVIVMARRS